MPATLTTAVIDALRGAPAKGMLVDVFRLPRGAGERRHLRTIETNDKGTVDAPLIAGDDLVVPATYELLYRTGTTSRNGPSSSGARCPTRIGPVTWRSW